MPLAEERIFRFSVREAMDQTQKPSDTILAIQELQIERKHVLIEIRENARGRFLKIVETTAGKRNTVIIPESGINDFNTAIDSVISKLRG